MNKVIIVDEKENAEVAAAVLKGHYEVVTNDGEKGLKAKLLADKPDIMLITADVENIAYKRIVTDIVRHTQDMETMPIAVITTIPTQQVVATAKEIGAEIIVRPYEPLEFVARIHKMGEQLKPLKERIDFVTGLHKREYTEDRIMELFPKKSGTLFIIDVAKFRFASQPISEQISAGSAEVVTEEAGHFNAILGVQKDRKFIGYIPDITERSICISWAEKLIKKIQERLQGQKVYVSIGFAANDEKSPEYKDLYQLCDRALNLAREKGSNMASYY